MNFFLHELFFVDIWTFTWTFFYMNFFFVDIWTFTWTFFFTWTFCGHLVSVFCAGVCKGFCGLSRGFVDIWFFYMNFYMAFFFAAIFLLYGVLRAFANFTRAFFYMAKNSKKIFTWAQKKTTKPQASVLGKRDILWRGGVSKNQKKKMANEAMWNLFNEKMEQRRMSGFFWLVLKNVTLFTLLLALSAKCRACVGLLQGGLHERSISARKVAIRFFGKIVVLPSTEGFVHTFSGRFESLYSNVRRIPAVDDWNAIKACCGLSTVVRRPALIGVTLPGISTLE